MPAIDQEIDEVLNCFQGADERSNKRELYKEYIFSADEEEVHLVRKLLHRKAFVGSKNFMEKIRHEIKNHIIEEEESRTIRRANPAFVLAGSLIILFLSIVTYNFYKNQTTLQAALNVTSNGLETVRDDLVSRVFNMQETSATLANQVMTLEKEVTLFKEKENSGLGGNAWKLQMVPVKGEKKDEAYVDYLEFKDGKIISDKLLAKGFTYFNYTLTQEPHGKIVWKTMQTNTDGLTVSWYGVVQGDKMRGVLSEHPAEGQSRDFSFVSMGRAEKPWEEENALQ
jgi:hypothetical protein